MEGQTAGQVSRLEALMFEYSKTVQALRTRIGCWLGFQAKSADNMCLLMNSSET